MRQMTIPMNQELFEMVEKASKLDERRKASFIRFYIQKVCSEILNEKGEDSLTA